MTKQKKEKCLSRTIDRLKVMEAYGDLFYGLRGIIIEHNPMRFHHLEDLPDEYDAEVATIITQLNHQMIAKEVHTLVFKEFKRWFAPIHGNKANYLELANAIFSWMQEINLPLVEIASMLREQKQYLKR